MFTLIKVINLIRNMGLRYLIYRIKHALKIKCGIYLRQFPIGPPFQEYIHLNDWLKNRPNLFLPNRLTVKEIYSFLDLEGRFPPTCLSGKFCFFYSDWKDLGPEYDWVSNPDNGYRYNAMTHWSKIEDYGTHTGDIKFVWEKSRFSYIYEIIRYDGLTGNDHSEFIWNEIISWIDANPINGGPNYKCSQEISLRVIAWTFALYFYSDSKTLTPEKFKRIQYAIFWQLKHVYDHIDFSRIAVRNNHALTETLALYVGGAVYAEMPGAQKWKVNGMKWFAEEVKYQVYEDGTFLQFSMNYHRVVIQLFTLAIAFSRSNNELLPPIIFARAYSSLNFLFQCQDAISGKLPNYGSNDGALFFPLSSCEYRDYRPQLNALHILLTGSTLYGSGKHEEEAVWWNCKKLSTSRFEALKWNLGWNIFNIGGYAVLRENDGLSFIRCGSHRDRPAQADNLHLDIWLMGNNVLQDSGTYKYNTTPDLLSWFMGSRGHNTVMLGQMDQMSKGPRFTWFNWSQSDGFEVVETSDAYIFSGVIQAFSYLSKKIRHKRTVSKIKGKAVWIVSDEIMNKPQNLELVQCWHPTGGLNFYSVGDNGIVSPEWSHGWVSEFYGLKESTNFLMFRTSSSKITTTISL